MFILSHADLPARQWDASIYDVLPTSLKLLGLPQPRGLRGKPLV